jgi:hypothetical protein
MTTASTGRARRTLAAAVALAGAVFSPLGLARVPAAHAQAHPACTFVLGFAVLRDRLPATVGVCLEEQQTDVANGDAYQRTTGGMLVWRKADNWTAFTDGYRTWVNGPRGIEERLNTQRFVWEADAPGTALLLDAPAPSRAPPAPPAPPAVPTPVTYQVRVQVLPQEARLGIDESVIVRATFLGFSGGQLRPVPGALISAVVSYPSGPQAFTSEVPTFPDGRAPDLVIPIAPAQRPGDVPVEVVLRYQGQEFRQAARFTVR